MNDEREAPWARRALLFIPGDSEKKIAKGLTLDVDAVILDLEDSVVPSNKAEAREIVRRALVSKQFPSQRTERLVRVNAARTGGDPPDPLAAQARDITATIQGRPDGYVLPKVESAQEVEQVARLLLAQEETLGFEVGRIQILALIETARGVVNLREIAAAHDRLTALIFGAEDLAADLGAIRSTEGAEVQYGRSAVVLHAAAFGLQAIDTPYVALDDLAGLRTEARNAMRMGFTGKLAIHPAQIAPIVEAFTPSDEEVAAAQRLIDAVRVHWSRGAGVFVYEGKMVDMPMIRAAERILARARAAGRT
jgi:citrate lyase beta subunit